MFQPDGKLLSSGLRSRGGARGQIAEHRDRISSPPSFPGEPRDVADRAWHAGPGYRDIAPLFDQARERLAPAGRLYLLLPSDSDLELFGALIDRAGFRARLAARRSIAIESLMIYML